MKAETNRVTRLKTFNYPLLVNILIYIHIYSLLANNNDNILQII